MRGPARRTSAPSIGKSSAFERATRLWAMSPQIATVSPAMRPLCSRIVNASSRAWVGCSCMPSPALTTALRVRLDDVVGGAGGGVPEHDHVGVHRVQRGHGVAQSVSPLLVLEDEPPRLTTSALRRLPASSNEVRVRVDAS